VPVESGKVAVIAEIRKYGKSWIRQLGGLDRRREVLRGVIATGGRSGGDRLTRGGSAPG
jgi:hypothetical protein